ncbi:hypothetical protein [Aurantiacibacter poecillastricola]|uniref:hypothetical protein n=1 Tax=Aurantiacibacter poecillastricola TaxID=3064385 RepID=UPI00273EF1F4|nr:hypothetical protein [Aurantiacibacter sp. 219JJ12-13]MDP5261577.1 hypothetical protein [Aurantiacibacter sp. 219JJ12-13]
MKRTIVLAAVAAMCASAPAATQERQLSEGQVSLYAEMWALAGVCLQYGGYEVEQAGLAEFLNDRLDGVGISDREQVAMLKQDRLEEIRAEIDRLEGLPRGSRRAREVEENAARLMTRCTRLANHEAAGDFFRR